jgi:membrane protein
VDGIKKRIAAIVAWVKKLFVVRVLTYYGTAQGSLLASGLAYQAIFAIFAALWVGFSIVGIVVAGDTALQQPLINAIGSAVPGLIKATPTSPGAIDPSVLLSSRSFTITGIIALVGVLVTALGWLSSARSAIRIIFGVPQSKVNFLVLKLRDLGVAVGFGVLMIISAALSVAGSAATGFLLGLIGVSPHSAIGIVVGKVVTIALSVLIDLVILGGLFRVLSGVKIPLRRLVGGVVVGSIALAALTVLGGSLLGVSKNNPLLASFAVILGLLIFFNFVCQIILISAAWVSVALTDRGLELGEMDRRRRPDVADKAADSAGAADGRAAADGAAG